MHTGTGANSFPRWKEVFVLQVRSISLHLTLGYLQYEVEVIKR